MVHSVCTSTCGKICFGEGGSRILPAVLWRVQKDKFQVLGYDLSFRETYLKNAGHSRPSLSGSGLAMAPPFRYLKTLGLASELGTLNIFRISPDIAVPLYIRWP